MFVIIIVGLHCGFEFRETTSVEFKSVPKDFWAFKSDFAEFNAIAILNYLGEFFFFEFFREFLSTISVCANVFYNFGKRRNGCIFSYFLAIFCEFLSTLSVCANVSYNFGEKRNKCIFFLFFGYFFLNFFQHHVLIFFSIFQMNNIRTTFP